MRKNKTIKFILLIIFTSVGMMVFGAKVLAAIRIPANFITVGDYPVTDANLILGGYHQVATIADRDAILTTKSYLKQEGMLVYVKADQKIYQLKPDNTWQEGAGGYWTLDGSSLYTNHTSY